MKITRRQIRQIIKEANDRDEAELRKAIQHAMKQGFMKKILMRIVKEEIVKWEEDKPEHWSQQKRDEKQATRRRQGQNRDRINRMFGHTSRW